MRERRGGAEESLTLHSEAAFERIRLLSLRSSVRERGGDGDGKADLVSTGDAEEGRGGEGEERAGEAGEEGEKWREGVEETGVGGERRGE